MFAQISAECIFYLLEELESVIFQRPSHHFFWRCKNLAVVRFVSLYDILVLTVLQEIDSKVLVELK